MMHHNCTQLQVCQANYMYFSSTPHELNLFFVVYRHLARFLPYIIYNIYQYISMKYSLIGYIFNQSILNLTYIFSLRKNIYTINLDQLDIRTYFFSLRKKIHTINLDQFDIGTSVFFRSSYV